MEKRLSRSDYLLMYGFIFMLICSVGTFFIGLNVGSNRTEARYEEQQKAKLEAAKVPGAYNQTYLVSFYHTVYLPYREFHAKWFDSVNTFEQSGGSADPADVMKELSKLASEKYDTIARQSMPESSPLLVDAQQNYMKSLKQFADAADSLKSKANSVPPAFLADQIRKNSSFIEAETNSLSAQKSFYDSIVKWNETDASGLKGQDLITQPNLSVSDWNQLNLNLKNDYIADLVKRSKYFTAYVPQDLTAHVDDMIKSGQAKKMNADHIQQIVDILIGTGAVRPGDFLKWKSKWYADETLPMLPFFSNP